MPSSSYQLQLPEHIQEQSDERISSFWVHGSPLLLQLSSYIRHEGEQISAQKRLNDRMQKDKKNWSEWTSKLHPSTDVDQATAQFIDDDGVVWLHSYFVWPHLTIYSTISGPPDQVNNPDNWALYSLKTIRLIIH